MQEEYEDIGMSWNEVKRTAQNRVQWKAAEEALHSGRSEEEYGAKDVVLNRTYQSNKNNKIQTTFISTDL